MNEDPANSNYSEQQLRSSFSKTRENIFNLLKKLIITENLIS